MIGDRQIADWVNVACNHVNNRAHFGARDRISRQYSWAGVLLFKPLQNGDRLRKHLFRVELQCGNESNRIYRLIVIFYLLRFNEIDCHAVVVETFKSEGNPEAIGRR